MSKESDEAVEARHLLGVTMHRQGQSELAIRTLSEVVRLRPERSDFHNNLGAVYQSLGRFADSARCFQEAVRLDPQCAEAFDNLGNALRSLGRFAEAVTALERAVRLAPAAPGMHRNLAFAYHQQGRWADALRAYESALALAPGTAQVHCNVAAVHRELGQRAEALAHLRTALGLDSRLANAHYALGLVCGDAGDPEAEAHLREAVRLAPGSAEMQNDLGNALQDRGLLDEARECYRRAVRAEPDLSVAHSNLVRCLSYDPAISSAALFAEHLAWARRHAEPLTARAPAHGNDRAPERRLRVGYLSPDFRDHVMGRHVEPLLAAHDRARFELTCYATTPRSDALTARLRASVDRWRSLAGVPDEEAAAQIRHDGIDVLVDLAGHTAGNRLLVVARKPAPVQITYLGYTTSTGLSALDYQLTDAHADPPGLYDSMHSETLLRLPASAWCFAPPVAPAVAHLPALSTGRVTFGSLNYPAKVNAGVIALWARVLSALPDARLLLLSHGPDAEHVRRRFAEHGIARARVEFRRARPRAEYLEYYHAVDIGLDTFPFCGGFTSFDALWMGVPVITLAGDSTLSRQGVSLLSGAGLADWIAATPDAYAELACALARDLPRLSRLRAGLRDRLAASPLMDVPAFVRGLEAAYRDAWRRWCAR